MGEMLGQSKVFQLTKLSLMHMEQGLRYTFFRTPTESNRLANTNGGKTTQNTEVKRLGTCEWVESEAAREVLDSPSFKETNAGNPDGNRQRENSRQRSSSILNTHPNFHIANIQNILAK